PGFFGNPGEPSRSAGIDDLLAPRRQIVEQRLLFANQRRVEPGRKTARRRVRHGGFERPPFGLPFWQTPVEQRDIVMSEEAQHPPGAAGGRQAGAVIDDNPVVVADAEPLYLAREQLG